MISFKKLTFTKKVLILFVVSLVTAVSLTVLENNSKYGQEYYVTGTVIGLNSRVQRADRSQIYTEYQMAVRPDNTSEYRPFDVEVSYVDFCQFPEGSRVGFNLYGSKVLKDSPTGWYYCLQAVLILMWCITIGLLVLSLVLIFQ